MKGFDLKKYLAENKLLQGSEDSIYVDWEEYVNPNFIVVTLKDNKKLKIKEKSIKGGARTYQALLQAFNENRYDLLNPIISKMIQNLSKPQTELEEGGYDKSYQSEKEAIKDLKNEGWRVVGVDKDNGEYYTIMRKGGETAFVYESGRVQFEFDESKTDLSEEEESGIVPTRNKLGDKKVRIVIEGPGVKDNKSKIELLLKKHDPDNEVKYFENTSKFVGIFRFYKIDPLKRDLKPYNVNVAEKALSQALKKS